MTSKQTDENEQDKQQSTRDQIRAKTLGKGRTLKSATHTVEGVEVTLRQPKIAERNEISELAKDENGNVNQLELIVWAIIRLTETPDTGERVFDDTDYNAFLEQPANSWVDELGEALLEMLNVSKESETKN